MLYFFYYTAKLAVDREFLMLKKEEYYTWNDFEDDVPKLVTKINSLGEKFNGIYGISRGGLPLAVKLSHLLDLPMLMGGVNEKSLVVDDVADTGSMLIPFKDRGATLVTIFYKPWSKIEPHIWLRKTESFIYFPWENTPLPIRQILPSP